MWLFIIYAFIGWCVEVAYAYRNKRRFINRGFLNGPFCPIYGFTALLVIFLISPLSNNLLLLFISAIILTSSIEFITGYVLERSFHQKWWDYKYEAFNIGGYICLKASIVWGVVCVVLVYGLQKPINNFAELISVGAGGVIAVLIISLMVVDTIITLLSLSRLRQRIHLLEDIKNKIEALTTAVNKGMSSSAITAIKTNNPLRDLDKLKQAYDNIMDEKVFGHIRLSRAFPKLDLLNVKLPPQKTRRAKGKKRQGK